MPADDSPAMLVARFLRSNNYNETLEAFLTEAGLPKDAGSTSNNSLTIERVLEEKKTYDLSVNFEKLGVEEEASKAWSLPAPTIPTTLSLPTSTNLLCISVESLLLAPGDAIPQQVLLASTADRRLNILATQGQNFQVIHSITGVLDSPILSFVVLKQRFLVCTSMSGKLIVWDTIRQDVVAERKDHSKYVVQVTSHSLTDDQFLLATAGWDGKILLYLARITPSDTLILTEPLLRIAQPTNPEALHFVTNPDDEDLYLITTRRDSTFLYYHHIPLSILSSTPSTLQDLPLHSRQNLAPHSNAWIAFTPAALAPCPTDPTFLAIATSAVPHMKLIIVRLLFPSAAPLAQGSPAPGNPATQQARHALAIANQENAAIQIHATTLAPQTQYSTPALAWRPDGTGVWVNGDDGVVRGIEAVTGKVVQTLRGGHEVDSKVRCLWAGRLGDGEGVEGLVSGGFDRRLVVWRVEEEGHVGLGRLDGVVD